MIAGATKNVKNAKKMDIDEIIFCLKSKYSGDKNQVVFIQSYRGEHSSKKILEEMKVMSKYAKESENMSLKNNISLVNGYRMHVAVINT